jgi:hypothetical protein
MLTGLASGFPAYGFTNRPHADVGGGLSGFAVGRVCDPAGTASVLVRIEQVVDAICVGDDMADVRDGGESVIRGYERIGPGRMGRSRQDGIECSDAGAHLEQAQALAQVGFFNDEQRREQLDVVTCQVCRIFPVAAAGSDVGEFLNDLDGGGGLDFAVGYGANQPLAWRLQQVVHTNGVDQDCGI